MAKDLSLKEWLEKWNAGEFNNPDVDTQIDAGWYDWFCTDKSLYPRLKRMSSKLKKVAQSPRVTALGLEKVYVFFKNNCPMCGSLYDDFRICDRKSGDVIYTITPASGHDSIRGEASVWGRENGFSGPLAKGTWKDVLEWFNVTTM